MSDQEESTHSPQEIRERYGDWIVLEKEPPRSISGTMGSHVFMLRAKSVEQLREQAEYILMRADGRGWNG